MKRTVLTSFFVILVFILNNVVYAASEEYVLKFKNVNADILAEKELDIVFFHIVDDVVVEKSSEKFILKFKTIAKDIESNIQFLINKKYFTEIALTDFNKKVCFDFLDRSVNVEDDIEIYESIIEGREVRTTKLKFTF